MRFTLHRLKFLLVAAVFVGLVTTSCERFRTGENTIPPETEILDATPQVPQIDSPHLGFGNATNASGDPARRDNFLIVGQGSVISYNDSRGTANWISWKTVREDLGDSIPRPMFEADTRLPNGFRRVQYFDYSGSGYERGHLVPSADRFAKKALNEETFLMSNIVPQTSALNQGPWQKLESFARAEARRGSDVYQIAGAYGEIERLRGKVTVPANCWKVIAIVPRGKRPDDLDRRMRIIAVDMPNSTEIENERWERFETTIRNIEEKAGVDLLRHLPRDVQDRLETRKMIRSGNR